MILEPHQVRSVSIRAVMPDQGRTPEDYAANVAARFGEGKLPSWAELAKRENRAMRKATGLQEHRPAAMVHSSEVSPRVLALLEARAARRESRNAAILDYLCEERTSRDVATRFKVSIETARQILRAMQADGMITTHKISRVTIYRRDDSAKPHSQAKPVTVRGEVFPSMSACARHFGISVQAVADRIRRGAIDTIVMRQEAAE